MCVVAKVANSFDETLHPFVQCWDVQVSVDNDNGLGLWVPATGTRSFEGRDGKGGKEMVKVQMEKAVSRIKGTTGCSREQALTRQEFALTEG